MPITTQEMAMSTTSSSPMSFVLTSFNFARGVRGAVGGRCLATILLLQWVSRQSPPRTATANEAQAMHSRGSVAAFPRSLAAHRQVLRRSLLCQAHDWPVNV